MWKRKLTSRKFWIAVAGLVSSVLVVFKVPDITVEQVTTIVMGFATVIAYIIGEGLTDSAAVKKEDKEGEV